MPLFDGVADEAAAVEALLDGRSPHLAVALRSPGDGEARIIATAEPALEEPLIFTRSLDRVLIHMQRLLSRAIEFFPGSHAARQDAPHTRVSSAEVLASARAAMFLGKGLAAKIAARLLRLCTHGHHWRIGWRRTQGDEVLTRLALPDAPYHFVPDDSRRYFADPFIFWKDGVAHVFCEEFPYATGKGVISAFAIGPDGTVSEPRVVLERPYHLSYPMVFEREGRIFMIPESFANRAVEIYAAKEFPHRWEYEATLIDGISASDATLTERDGRLWLFATVNDEGASTWDSLGLFHAAQLFGPWTAHAANPVLIDVTSARPAGMMAERDGILLRPAQDCTGGYGSALTLCRVDRLDAEHFQQTVLKNIKPDPRWRATGTHTLNAARGIEVIDCAGTRWKGSF
jgi:hypothetical protein